MHTGARTRAASGGDQGAGQAVVPDDPCIQRIDRIVCIKKMICQRAENMLPGDKRFADGNPRQQYATHQRTDPNGMTTDSHRKLTNSATHPARITHDYICVPE